MPESKRRTIVRSTRRRATAGRARTTVNTRDQAVVAEATHGTATTTPADVTTSAEAV